MTRGILSLDWHQIPVHLSIGSVLTRGVRRLLQQAQDQLANLRSPPKPTEITQAQANLRDAQAARDRAQEDLRRSRHVVDLVANFVRLADDVVAETLRSASVL